MINNLIRYLENRRINNYKKKKKEMHIKDNLLLTGYYLIV